MNKIFIFSNVRDGREGVCLALADDGHVLGSHWCSHEEYAKFDLGMVEGYRQERRDAYAKHFPNGYTMEFIPAKEVKKHEGVKAAYKLNQALKLSSEEKDPE